jgi:subtilisin family serine protease
MIARVDNEERMSSPNGIRAGLALGTALAALAVALPIAPAAAHGLARPARDAVLSPSLAMLAKPSVRSKSREKQAAILDMAVNGPGSLLRDGNRVLVRARFDEGAIARLRALRAAGARVVSASRRYQTVTVAVAPVMLRSLAGVPGVVSITESRAPILFGPASTAVGGEGTCEGGEVISEGLTQLRVDEAREAFGLRGKGMTVGVLSDSFDKATEAADGSGPVATHAHEDIVSNDLPGPAGTCSDQQVAVDVLDDNAPGENADEGRAMLQIVHDLAPHASLAFATAFTSEESFAQNIEQLAKPPAEGGAGADLIVDDVAYFEEPFFQDGPVAAAVNKVTGEGVFYLSAAGNDNLFDSKGHEIASWEAPEYRDSGGCPAAVEALPGFNATHCMDFKPSGGPDRTFGITVKAHATLTLDLQWAEPWGGVNSDLDTFLLNGSEQFLAASFEENSGKTGTQRPVEILQWTNNSSSAQTVDLVINRFSGASPRLKFILLENGSGVTATEYPESGGGDVVGPTIFGHAGAASAIALGAVPFNNSSQPESYSSRGPVTHYFEQVEGIAPAAPLGSPETIAKPDVVATDCGATTFFAGLSGGVWRFCGTSAAAPHAAAVAALLRQGDPNASLQEVRESLVNSAVPVGSFPPEAVGSGLIDAFAAVESLPELIGGGDGPSTVVPPLEVGNSTVTVIPETPPSAPEPPSTFFSKRPPRLVRTSHASVRLVFRFGSDQANVSFLCKVDGGAFIACSTKLARRFSVGVHVVKVKARNAAGQVDESPAVFRFRVKRAD